MQTRSIDTQSRSGDPQSRSSDAPAGAPLPLTEVRLLLVEDSDGDALLVETLIVEAQAGTPLRPAVLLHRVARLSAALELLARQTFDVVLVDLGLPDAAGLDAVRMVRAATPALPIVVLTGLDDDVTPLAALRAGAQDYLVKGAATGDLVLRAVRYAMERKRAEDEVARARWLAGIGETALAVSHEVNNPLTALLLHAELLREHGGHDPEAVEAIAAEASRIAEVVRRLAELDQPRVVEHLAGVRMLDLSPGRGGQPAARRRRALPPLA